jgi:hypothetical protein
MRWSVYACPDQRRGKRLAFKAPIPLGYVNAPDFPKAVRAACAKWPEREDWMKMHAGFSVRVYSTDAFSLGKIGKQVSRQSGSEESDQKSRIR